ncbi:DUF317 domain-containing protein [Streptomyces sp. NPDC006704]|uniref:DUF317 domain-containing protein n=1 Tax=Streptomyces sp. NPDC006704 TaxID=3364760 RepID=UPI00367F6C25
MPDRTTTDGDVLVSPRYLAGLGHVDPMCFESVKEWPHHDLGDRPCQLLITSPDHRIKIGWFGDDFDVWKISAAEDAVSASRWMASISDKMPPEIVRDFVHALAGEWGEDSESFLTNRSYYWTDAVQPLLDAGWERRPVAHGSLEIVSPDQLAGASIDVVSTDPDAEVVTLWAGSDKQRVFRAEANFTAHTPKHLIAAMAASFVAPAPIARYQADLSPRLAQLAQLTPVEPPKSEAPTPLDIQRAAAARRPPALGTRGVPRWSTTSLPPALPAGRGGPRR